MEWHEAEVLRNKLQTGSGDSRMKKVGGHCGAKEKIGGANINVYLAW